VSLDPLAHQELPETTANPVNQVETANPEVPVKTLNLVPHTTTLASNAHLDQPAQLVLRDKMDSQDIQDKMVNPVNSNPLDHPAQLDLQEMPANPEALANLAALECPDPMDNEELADPEEKAYPAIPAKMETPEAQANPVGLDSLAAQDRLELPVSPEETVNQVAMEITERMEHPEMTPPIAHAHTELLLWLLLPLFKAVVKLKADTKLKWK